MCSGFLLCWRYEHRLHPLYRLLYVQPLVLVRGRKPPGFHVTQNMHPAVIPVEPVLPDRPADQRARAVQAQDELDEPPPLGFLRLQKR